MDIMDIIDVSAKSKYRRGMLKKVVGFVVHHTGGRGSVAGVVVTLNQRKLGVHYVMDRTGQIYRTLPEGARGAHIKVSPSTGLSNSNTLGIEVIARNDADILPVQVTAAVAFIAAKQAEYKFSPFKVFGHGAINSHKQATEGKTIADAYHKMKWRHEDD
jgi:N-acetyl-anhydromuramyl-L-alanine amidase AmpD